MHPLISLKNLNPSLNLLIFYTLKIVSMEEFPPKIKSPGPLHLRMKYKDVCHGGKVYGGRVLDNLGQGLPQLSFAHGRNLWTK